MRKTSKLKDTYALIENIYYSLSFTGNYNEWISIYLQKFAENQTRAYEENNILVDDIMIIPGIQRYPFGYKIADRFRIYFSSKVGDNFPVHIIISAQELHTNEVSLVLENALQTTFKIIRYYDTQIDLHRDYIQYKLSRVDVCNHNTFIDMDDYIRVNEYNSRTVTKLSDTHPWIDLVGEKEQKVAYFRYGQGDLVVRFYNKIREICKEKYKDFFIPKWLDYGLIDEKTFDIYTLTYKIGKNFWLDFIWSTIYYSDNEELKVNSLKIYTHKTKSAAEKIDILSSMMKKYKVKLAPIVVNVEFQLRSSYLKSLKIKDDDGNIIDYNNIYEILYNIEKLYDYLTYHAFRVIPRNHNYKRKRAVKENDPLWERIRKSEILNIGETNIDLEKLEIYREYSKNMSKLHTAKRIVNSAAHLYYINNDYTIEDVNQGKVNIDNLFNDFFEEYMMNETYYHLKDKLISQIQRYGKKK